jgi:hypothetical protein
MKPFFVAKELAPAGCESAPKPAVEFRQENLTGLFCNGCAAERGASFLATEVPFITVFF